MWPMCIVPLGYGSISSTLYLGFDGSASVSNTRASAQRFCHFISIFCGSYPDPAAVAPPGVCCSATPPLSPLLLCFALLRSALLGTRLLLGVRYSLLLCFFVYGNFLLERRCQHREALFRFRCLLLQTRQLPEHGHIPPVIAGIVNRRLGHKGSPRQSFGRRGAKSRVLQNPRERFRTNLSFSDVLVAVHPSAQRNLRIVRVNHRHVFESDRAINLANRRSQPAFALDVVARGKKVRRIKTRSDRQVSQPRQNLSHFFQPRAHCRSHSGGVLDQYPQSAHWRALGGLF